MPQFLFYKKIIPIDRAQHRDLKVAPVTDYSFTAKANSVPITAFEFALAGRDCPLVFVAGDDGGYMPAAMLSVKEKTNNFVNAKGSWTGKYLPLYIRQYPFMAAEKKDSTDVTICLDMKYAGVGTGETLFDADGKESPWFQQTLEISNMYLTHMKRTLAFCRTLQELNLLESLSPKMENNRTGQVSRIEGLFAVSEPRLNQLSDVDALRLFRSGDLAWIYLHLASLANFSVLANR